MRVLLRGLLLLAIACFLLMTPSMADQPQCSVGPDGKPQCSSVVLTHRREAVKGAIKHAWEAYKYIPSPYPLSERNFLITRTFESVSRSFQYSRREFEGDKAIRR